MKKKMLAVVWMMLAAGSAFAAPLKLDMGLSSSAVEPGWQQFIETDNGSTLFDGVKVTISGIAGWRYRNSDALSGIPNEQLWRDFVYANSNMVITIEGLKPSIEYELSIGTFDIDSKTNTPRAADWKVGTETILTTSFGIPGVPIATLVPSSTRNYLFSGYAFSDATGKIVMQAYPAPSHNNGAYAFVNGLVIEQSLWAFDPTPDKGAKDQALNTTLEWKTGRDPNDFSMPNPKIRTHYLYISYGDPSFAGVSPISISAGSPVSAIGSYGPLSLNYDDIVYWRVDEGVNVGGVVSGPSDPATIVGRIWSFEVLKSVPILTGSPVSAKVPAGQAAQFTVEFDSISPAMVTWYKNNDPIVPDSRITVDTTDQSSALNINEAQMDDEGAYTCRVLNAGGDFTTDPAYLAISRLLAQYRFEQNCEDSVGDSDGAAVGSMNYAEGIVTLDGQYWAADPNGSTYFLVPASKAYPRAGYGNGLEEFTYSFWVKRGSHVGNGRILGNFNDGTTTAVQINVTGEGALGILVRQENGANREFTTDKDQITEDQWHHVAFTFNSQQVRCYIDGVFRWYVDAYPLPDFADWQYPMAIMARNVRGTVNEPYSGMADDLRIYNYAMDREQVARLYYEVTNIRPCAYGYPALDITGPEGVRDCVVDLYDFAEFAASWLESGLLVP